MQEREALTAEAEALRAKLGVAHAEIRRLEVHLQQQQQHQQRLLQQQEQQQQQHQQQLQAAVDTSGDASSSTATTLAAAATAGATAAAADERCVQLQLQVGRLTSLLHQQHQQQQDDGSLYRTSGELPCGSGSGGGNRADALPSMQGAGGAPGVPDSGTDNYGTHAHTRDIALGPKPPTMHEGSLRHRSSDASGQGEHGLHHHQLTGLSTSLDELERSNAQVCTWGVQARSPMYGSAWN